jgi:hypothetical protein
MTAYVVAQSWRICGAQNPAVGRGCATTGLKAGFVAQHTRLLRRLVARLWRLWRKGFGDTPI